MEPRHSTFNMLAMDFPCLFPFSINEPVWTTENSKSCVACPNWFPQLLIGSETSLRCVLLKHTTSFQFLTVVLGLQVGLANILEIIVDTLKDRIEVSYLFLKPVSKKEAPDYLKIIKHPMDLSTIKEKVRKLEYKSREEFRHDVWQITYNAHKYNDGRNPGIPPLADQLLELCDYLLNEHDLGLTEAEDGIEYMDG